MIMQENRSFDEYFGTFPGANGIPMQDGVPTVCAPDPSNGTCVAPFHDSADLNHGGPHGTEDSIGDINGGKMDGFVAQMRLALQTECGVAHPPVYCPDTAGTGTPDVMGYHDAREIPNYWAYAHQFVLQDAMFESAASWSLPAHLYMVSAWSARCTTPGDPMSCNNTLEIGAPNATPGPSGFPNPPDFAWTDLTWLLHAGGVSWAYYVADGFQPDCEDDGMLCPPKRQSAGTPAIWNPLPWFDTVRENNQLSNIRPLTDFVTAVKDGTLPSVSWITPDQAVSEHPPSLISHGQAYVTGLINAIMQSPEWSSTAIFVSWDDWGGFYDHVVPPTVDSNGYGLRVPGLVISPYAKAGYIDHQTLSYDAYLKFIEDDFLASARIDPTTDGRPDLRPDVRENAAVLGDLSADFDFNQPPRAPLILDPWPNGRKGPPPVPVGTPVPSPSPAASPTPGVNLSPSASAIP